MHANPLPLLVDELFDVEAAIRELERRKETLRAGILDELRRASLGGIESRRGLVTLQGYSSFRRLQMSREVLRSSGEEHHHEGIVMRIRR